MGSPLSAVITGDPANKGPKIIVDAAHTLQERVAHGDFFPKALGVATARTTRATCLGLLGPFGFMDAAAASAGSDLKPSATMDRDGTLVPLGLTLLTTAGTAST